MRPAQVGLRVKPSPRSFTACAMPAVIWPRPSPDVEVRHSWAQKFSEAPVVPFEPAAMRGRIGGNGQACPFQHRA